MPAGRGPAVTLVEYLIDPKTGDEFLQGNERDEADTPTRRRDPLELASRYRGPATISRNLVTESWAEHLRQHERVTAEDREAEQRVQAFHLGPQPTRITHLIAEQLPK